MKSHQFQSDLLAWYDVEARLLPWRAFGTKKPRAYHVWLSEIMLQQTTVAAVIPYFEKFLRLWPDIHALAAAPLDDVLREWAGLGYYARARHLHHCAKIVSTQHKGNFPAEENLLRQLPGIGTYTAAAISAIAFSRHAVVIDGNIERVTARIFGIELPLKQAKRQIRQAAENIYENAHRAGDLAQAMMDLGARICIPKIPRCTFCQVKRHCQAFLSDRQNILPVKAEKKEKPVRHGKVYWLENDQQIALVKRDNRSLLGGMVAFPSEEWDGSVSKHDYSGYDLNLMGAIRHSFTHFDLHLEVWGGQINDHIPNDFFLVEKESLPDIGLPTLFKKILKVIPDA